MLINIVIIYKYSNYILVSLRPALLLLKKNL
jgi:hypothetical protein